MASVDVDQFRFLSHKIIEPQLAASGFEPDGEMCWEEKGGLRQRSLIYRSGRRGAENLYVLIQLVGFMSYEGKDVEWVQAMLGEGSHENLEASFNSVSIWEITEMRQPGFIPSNYYLVADKRPLESILTHTAQQLLAQAVDFFAGDLSNFHKVRATKNAVPRHYPLVMCDSAEGYLATMNADV